MELKLQYEEDKYEGKWQDKSLPLWARQAELEAVMKCRGSARFKNIIEDAKKAKSESMTKHGQMLLKGLIQPMSEGIKEFVDSNVPAPRRKPELAAKVLARLDYEVVALITGKYVLDCISLEQTLSKASIRIGEALEMECRLEEFSEQETRYFRRLHRALQEKRNYRHKRKVYNAKIKHFKIDCETAWDKNLKLQVGLKCLYLLKQHTGLVDFVLKTVQKHKTIYYVQATEETKKWIENYNGNKEFLFPEYLPMLTKPRDWKAIIKKNGDSDWIGGYNSKLGKLPLVKVDSQDYLEDLSLHHEDMPELYQAVNAIQKTAWKINKDILDVVVSCWEKNNGLGELPPRSLDNLEPPKPFDIATNDKARKTYKIKMRKFCDWKVTQISKIIQVKRIITIAKVFQEEKALYFPHQLDFRGRIYAIPMFLHPQYADYARSLLHFSKGKALTTSDDACWLAIHGANSFGFDKVALDERINWVSDNQEMIFKCAEDPHNNTEWSKADKPYQFLAFCFEWKKFSRGDGEFNFGFESHISVQVDGSCNGLQHFSAMLKDPVGGAAVNLTPLDKPADIYGQVADRVNERLRDLLNDSSKFGEDKTDAKTGEVTYAKIKSSLAQQWLQFGVDRKIVKRPVMTLPYGSRRYSHRKYIMEEVNKRKDKGAKLPADWKDDLYTPTFFLATIALTAIHETVHAARDVMAWLQQTSRVVSNIKKDEIQEDGKTKKVPANLPIEWTTPVGFKVRQAYPDTEMRRVKSLMGENIIKLSFREKQFRFDPHGNEELIIDRNSQAMGISPNYVHSMDGAALMKCVALASVNEIENFQCIHDAFGTYASDTPKLLECIKQSFIEIYSTNQLEKFRTEILAGIYKEEDRLKIPPLPKQGDLKIEDIWDSDFFFA